MPPKFAPPQGPPLLFLVSDFLVIEIARNDDDGDGDDDDDDRDDD